MSLYMKFIVRLFMGWTTNSDANPKLFNIFSKCTDDGFTLNFHEYYGRDCKDNKCLWTTKQCYSTLYNKDKGLLDSMMDITNTFNKFFKLIFLKKLINERNII